jgi:hypothetical protein
MYSSAGRHCHPWKSASQESDRLWFTRGDELSNEKWKLKNAKCGQPLLPHGMLETKRLVHFEFFIRQ